MSAIIYGFNVKAIKTVEEEATAKGIPLRLYNIVYKLIDNVKAEINSLLPEVDIEEITGNNY